MMDTCQMSAPVNFHQHINKGIVESAPTGGYTEIARSNQILTSLTTLCETLHQK